MSMASVIAIANQKGRVAKRTSTMNLASLLARRGKRVLAVDADPQASLTVFAGHDLRVLDREERSLYFAPLRDRPFKEVIVSGAFDLLPSGIRLASGEVEVLVDPHSGPEGLRHLLRGVRDAYDFILIDSPPNLGILTTGALTAADQVLIPVKTDYISVMGIPLLLDTIRKTRRRNNPGLEVIGVLPTIFNPGYQSDTGILEQLRAMLKPGIRVFEPVNRSTTFDRWPAEGRPTVEAYPHTPGVAAYRALADHVTGHG
jgi:chromosome partitioning protein